MIKSKGPQDFDPLAPETFDSPYDVYRDLRQRCPVAHSQAWNGFWALMEYDDVLGALQQTDTTTAAAPGSTGTYPVPPRAQSAVQSPTNAGAGAGNPAPRRHSAAATG